MDKLLISSGIIWKPLIRFWLISKEILVEFEAGACTDRLIE